MSMKDGRSDSGRSTYQGRRSGRLKRGALGQDGGADGINVGTVLEHREGDLGHVIACSGFSDRNISAKEPRTRSGT